MARLMLSSAQHGSSTGEKRPDYMFLHQKTGSLNNITLLEVNATLATIFPLSPYYCTNFRPRTGSSSAIA